MRESIRATVKLPARARKAAASLNWKGLKVSLSVWIFCMVVANKKGDGDPSPFFNHGIASVGAGDRLHIAVILRLGLPASG